MFQYIVYKAIFILKKTLYSCTPSPLTTSWTKGASCYDAGLMLVSAFPEEGNESEILFLM